MATEGGDSGSTTQRYVATFNEALRSIGETHIWLVSGLQQVAGTVAGAAEVWLPHFPFNLPSCIATAGTGRRRTLVVERLHCQTRTPRPMLGRGDIDRALMNHIHREHQ